MIGKGAGFGEYVSAHVLSLGSYINIMAKNDHELDQLWSIC